MFCWGIKKGYPGLKDRDILEMMGHLPKQERPSPVN